MFTVRLCGLDVQVDNRYSHVERLCRDYVVPTAAPLFRVRVTEAEVEAYRAACGRPMTAAEAESALLYRAICGRLPAYDALLLHAAAFRMDGRGYAVSAARGVGKTTHLQAWKEIAGDRLTVINGDKPLLHRGSDGHWRMYGTPWCGKEGEQTNTSCPLNAILFLERGQVNTVTPSLPEDTAAGLLTATILPPTPALRERMADLIGRLVREVPAYRITCLPDRTAAEAVYETLSRL